MPPSSSSCAVLRVRPKPPAVFSPLAMTRSIPYSLRSSGTNVLIACLPGRPTISPITNIFIVPYMFICHPERSEGSWWGTLFPTAPPRDSSVASLLQNVHLLLGVVNSPGLPDNSHLYLTRIFQGFLHLFHNVTGQPHGAQVIDSLRLDQDTHFASGLDGE